MTTWFQRDPARLATEYTIMGQRFPHFTLNRLNDTTLYWLGTLRPTGKTAYELMVVYPDNFPYAPPEATPTRPVITDAKHLYRSGQLCLFKPGDQGDQAFGAGTTAATVVAKASAWFFAYEAWLASGRQHWPGPEAH